jgi:hypothetical protein
MVVFFLLANFKLLHAVIRLNVNLNVAFDDFIKLVQQGNVEQVRQLVVNGFDFRQQNDRALIVAVETGHFENVRLLLENGADVYAQDDLALRNAAST